MISIAVVGAHGYVGSALCAALARRHDRTVTPVTRSNYDEMRRRTFDILINSAMPAKRFWAKTHPEKDFVETVQKTADLVYGWCFGKFVQISSVSARCQLDTVYGRHKAAAEKICGFGTNLIVRLGPMYSNSLSTGVLIDMLEGRAVFADAESRYCFAPLEFVASWIAANLERVGTVEAGARNGVRLKDVADYIGSNVQFEGPVDHQEINNPEPDFPDAREVFAFLRSVMNGQSEHDWAEPARLTAENAKDA